MSRKRRHGPRWRLRTWTAWPAMQPPRRGSFTCTTRLPPRGAPLLLTGRRPPARWGLGLPDLDSRMRQAELARIDAPDDRLLSALLLKLSHDRGLRLTPAILSHVLPRIERSAAALHGFVGRLDARALAVKRPPRLSDAKAALAEDMAPVSPSRHNS